MFYDVLISLCNSKNTTVTATLKELNISTSKGTAWKNGSIPNGDIIAKIADYFNVTTDYLLEKETATKKDPASDDQIKFALFGTTEVDDDLYEDIKKIAKLQQQLKAEKLKKGKGSENSGKSL